MKPYNSFAVAYVPGNKSPNDNNSPYKDVIVESVNEEDIHVVSVTFLDSITEKEPNRTTFIKEGSVSINLSSG